MFDEEEKKGLETVNDIHHQIAVAINKVRNDIPSSRERSLVITKLQEADLWLSCVPLS